MQKTGSHRFLAGCVTAGLILLIAMPSLAEPVVFMPYRAEPRCQSTDCVFNIIQEVGKEPRAVAVKKCDSKISLNLSDLNNAPDANSCHGATHIYQGKVVIGKLIFDSDSKSPLTFKVDKDKGYLYIKGKGKVTLADGTVKSLP
jgi:hypothetical protein